MFKTCCRTYECFAPPHIFRIFVAWKRIRAPQRCDPQRLPSSQARRRQVVTSLAAFFVESCTSVYQNADYMEYV